MSVIGSRTRVRKAGILVSMVAAIGLATASIASADTSIDTAGPLDHIYLNSDLSCQATHTGDTVGEFYADNTSTVDPNGACGTFLSWPAAGEIFDNSVFGPNVPAGGSTTEFHQVSQSPSVTGSGTTADPYKVVTVVNIEQPCVESASDATPAQCTVLVTVTQTDSYVVGDEFYRTDIQVENTGFDGTVNATLYHAGDCFLQDSDKGFGWFNPSDSGPYCTANPGNSPFGRIEGFVPLSGGNTYVEELYNHVWSRITNGLDFPNSVDTNGDPSNPGASEDNGAGLAWDLSIESGQSETRSLLTRFSPTGGAPPPTVAQQPPPKCKLRISRARVFLFRRHPRLRLVARYRSSDPADVLINFIAIEGGNKVNLGDVTRHFRRHGLFRLREELSQEQSDTLWQTHSFIVHFKIPGEPGFCERKYKKELTVPRIVDGQRVVFQSDSKFGPGSPGHPAH
jgi:hypothetical protein